MDFQLIPRISLLHLFTAEPKKMNNTKMGFDGCGISHGFRGALFGSGLDEQSDQAIQRIVKEIEAGNEVTLNVYGHSRGAVGALLLAQQLSSIDPNKLSINLAMLDPVPGNLITTSTLDPLNISLANKTMDLSGCKPLKRVLALYPHAPLSSLLAHAPLFVTYPPEVEVEEEVIAGCHAQAEILDGPGSLMARWKIEEFMTHNGTKIDTSVDYTNKDQLKKSYISEYERALRDSKLKVNLLPEALIQPRVSISIQKPMPSILMNITNFWPVVHKMQQSRFQ